MKNGDGFIVVYSIDNRFSFEDATNFIDQTLRLRDQKAEEVPILIVGNKKDLEENRQVKTREGAALAKKYGVDFIETSAKTGENIEEAFKRICFLIWSKKDGFKHPLLEEWRRNVSFLAFEEWKEEEHSKLPETFKKRVKTLLLMLKRNEKNENKLKVPKPIVKEIIKLVFKQDSQSTPFKKV